MKQRPPLHYRRSATPEQLSVIWRRSNWEIAVKR